MPASPRLVGLIQRQPAQKTAPYPCHSEPTFTTSSPLSHRKATGTALMYSQKIKINKQPTTAGWRSVWQPTVDGDGSFSSLRFTEGHHSSSNYKKDGKGKKIHSDDEEVLRACWNIWNCYCCYLSWSVCNSRHQLSPLAPAASDLRWSNYAGWPPTGRLSKGPPKINIHSFRSVICFWHYRPRSMSALLFLLFSALYSFTYPPTPPALHQQPGS